MKGFALHTQQIFEAVAKLDCIKPYLLVGGTALSYWLALNSPVSLVKTIPLT